MKQWSRKIRISIVLVQILCVVCFTGCNIAAELSSKDTKTVVTSENEAIHLEIANYEEAVNAILSNTTKEFIGYYPIDESFLGFVASIYGTQVVEKIAENNDYSDPDLWYDLTGESIHVLWLDYCETYGLYNSDRIYRIQTASEEETVIDFSGDFSLAETVATTEYMESQPNGITDCFSSGLLEEMQSADLFMINNEFCYSNRGTPLSGKAYTFRANPEYVSYLQSLGVDFVNLANNHVWDYDEEALVDTFDTLDGANIPYVGAGRNLEEAMRPIYYVANGKKIAIVAATQIEKSYNYTKQATEDSPGVLKTLDSALFVSEIEQAEKKADYVIAVVHWGTEGNASYGEDQVRLAQDFIDAGADAIIGGHTHCLQGIEYKDGVPVYYSLGNYWFSVSGAMPAAYDTGLAQLRITSDGEIETYFIPCEFSYGVTSLASETNQQEKILDKLQNLSKYSTISSDGKIQEK
jgi:poly-gamma-glutamate synthesis protein (capsule biosynthesis protein)